MIPHTAARRCNADEVKRLKDEKGKERELEDRVGCSFSPGPAQGGKSSIRTA